MTPRPSFWDTTPGAFVGMAGYGLAFVVGISLLGIVHVLLAPLAMVALVVAALYTLVLLIRGLLTN